jgi:cation-transporting ATPase 13A2
MRIMDVVTVTIPPGLPVSMTLGIIYAVEKLERKSIFCTSQNNVIKGGSVTQVCFDKTGTLT